MPSQQDETSASAQPIDEGKPSSEDVNASFVEMGAERKIEEGSDTATEQPGGDGSATNAETKSASKDASGSRANSTAGNSKTAGTDDPVVVDVDGEESVSSPKSMASPPPLSSDSISIEPYNHQKQQEIARRYIAYALVGMVTLLVILSFWYLFVLPLSPNTNKYVVNLLSLLQVLFGPLVTLTATAIGYYFGANAKDSK